MKNSDFLSGDRPYAAHLSAGVFRVAANSEKHIRESVSIQVGVMGAASLGEATQNVFHRITPAVRVQGWGNQLGQALFVQGNYLYEKGLRLRKNSELRWQGIGSAGLLQVAAEAGLYYRFRQLIPFDEHWILASKARAGEGLQAYVFVNPQVVLRAYDATLQGGYFGLQNRFAQPWQQMNIAMGLLKSGFWVAHGKFGIGLFHVLATPEFRGALIHNLANIELTIRF